MTVPDPGPATSRVGTGLVRGAAWTGAHVVLSVPVAFVVNVVVARRLGVVDYGELAVLTMVLTLATATASLGVGAALLQFSTKALEAGKLEEVVGLIRGAQGYNLLIAAPLVAVVVTVVVDAPWPMLLLAVVFGVLGPAALQVGPTLLAAQHRSDRAAQLAIVSNIIVQTAVVVTVLAIPSPEAVWVARIVAVGLLMTLPFLALSSVLRRAALSPRSPFELPRAFWAFAIPTGLATLVSTLVTDRVQVFFLQWLASPATVGVFALAFGLAGQILTPVQAAVGPLIPALSALTERGTEAARAGFLHITRLSAVMTGLVVSAGAPMLAGMIPFIYGADYGPASDLFLVMVCSSGLVVVGAVSYASLMARLQGTRYLWVNLLALVVMVAVAVAAIPALGPWGAVASVVAGTLARALLMVGIEASHYRIGIGELLSAFGPVLMAGAATLGVWFLGAAALPTGAWTRAVAGALATSLIYVIGLKVTRSGVRPADRDMLLAAVPGRLRPVMSVTLRVLSSS